MDKQGIIVIVLILAAWLGYQTFVRGPELERWRKAEAEWQEAQRKKAEEAAAAGTGAVDSADPTAVTTRTPAGAPPVEAVASAHPHVDKIAFETPHHTIALSTSGASVEELTFKDIRDTTYVAVATEGYDPKRERRPFKILHPFGVKNVHSFAVEPLDAALAAYARGDWAHEALPGGGHRFWLVLPNGIKLTKLFTVPDAPAEAEGPPQYHFDLAVAIENTTGAPIEFGYRVLGPAGMVDDSGDRRTSGQAAVLATRVDRKFEVEPIPAVDLVRTDGPDKSIGKPANGDISYFGNTTKYFAAVVIPRGAPVEAAEAQGLLQTTGKLPTDKDDPDGLAHQALAWGKVNWAVIPPGTPPRVDSYMVYVGPKQKAVFEADDSPYADRGLDKLIDFGWFEFMARILLSVLGMFQAVVVNWGVAIILLTFLVRSLLLPLSMWSQKNMLRMQKLAPELNKLKEKYTRKDGTMTPEAQRQFSVEQMELMRKVGVNPVGCLGPIFLQLPVFIGLWNALNYAFELRGQPFALWITDLSVPEVLFRLPVTLPLLGTDAFSVLPLIMVFVYWLQQKMQPVATDPRAAEQQKMMKFIIPVFGLMLYTAPSGLMLYFITSSIWSIVEQKWVKKRIEATEGPMPGVAAPMMG